MNPARPNPAETEDIEVGGEAKPFSSNVRRSRDYLQFISWWVGVCMTVIILGGSAYLAMTWKKMDSIELNLQEINRRGEKLSRRLAFVEVVNREVAIKSGVNVQMLEKIQSIQEKAESDSKVKNDQTDN